MMMRMMVRKEGLARLYNMHGKKIGGMIIHIESTLIIIIHVDILNVSNITLCVHYLLSDRKNIQSRTNVYIHVYIFMHNLYI